MKQIKKNTKWHKNNNQCTDTLSSTDLLIYRFLLELSICLIMSLWKALNMALFQAGGVEILSETLAEVKRPEPEISEAAAVLAQITAPWVEDNHSVQGLSEQLPSLVNSLTRKSFTRFSYFEVHHIGSDGSMSASGPAGPGFYPRRGSKFSFEIWRSEVQILA